MKTQIMNNFMCNVAMGFDTDTIIKQEIYCMKPPVTFWCFSTSTQIAYFGRCKNHERSAHRRHGNDPNFYQLSREEAMIVEVMET
jgi:hypothetical protein